MGDFAVIWTIISAVVALIGGVVLHFTFLKEKNDGRFKGFLGWLYDFLTFRKMMLESLLRVLYIICVVFITLASFAAPNIIIALLSLIFGNIAVRIVYEFSLIMLVICRNTSEISKKLNPIEEKAEEKAE